MLKVLTQSRLVCIQNLETQDAKHLIVEPPERPTLLTATYAPL